MTVMKRVVVMGAVGLLAACDTGEPADPAPAESVELDVEDLEVVSEYVAPEVVEEMEEVLDEFAAAEADPQAFFFNGFDAAYVDCDEYAGVGPTLAIETARALVPDDYTVIEPFPGAAIVVAQAGDCASIEIEGWDLGPGRFAQIGVSVVPPGDAGNGDFYQLAYATTNPLLALKLKLMGVNASWAPDLVYEISASDDLTIEMPRPKKFAYRLEGPITRPDPNATPNPETIFNYYAEGNGIFGQVLQQNVVQGIIFGEGSGVMLTPLGDETKALTNDAPLAFPFFSAPETFDRADLFVVPNSF